MVLDTSAIAAIFFGEPEAAAFSDRIARTPHCFLSAATLLESSIVLERRFSPEACDDLDLYIYRAGIEVVPVDEAQARLARRAYRNYGKGNHPAGLNYGDCFAYALARMLRQPLLFKGDDFSMTDLPTVRV